ncbi:MAG TPA: hypothetical protein VMB82_14145 [Acidimicrobiales bacterium]|nr:hypothetical protein [Acidimicrobiales bacterium]
MAVSPFQGSGSGRVFARRAGIGDPGPARGLAEILVLPAPARRHRARTALAQVFTHLRTEAASKGAFQTLPPPRGSRVAHGHLPNVPLPDDVA